MAAISTALLTLLKSGDEIVCCSAIYGGTFHIIEDLLPKLGIAHRFVSIDELADPAQRHRSEDQDRLVRVADQSDAALRRRADRRRRVQEGRRAVGDRQHLCQPDQSAGAVDGHRPVDAKLHQVSERPQRRHRRRAVGIAGADGADRQDAAAARRHHGSAAGVCARPRHEDHAASRRAAQRQRADGGAVSRRASRRSSASITRAWRRIPITASPRGR